MEEEQWLLLSRRAFSPSTRGVPSADSAPVPLECPAKAPGSVGHAGCSLRELVPKNRHRRPLPIPPLHFPLWKRNARPFPFGHRDSRGRLRTLSASTAQNPHATVSRRPPLPTAGPDSPLTSWNGVSHPGLRPQVQLRRVLLKTTVKGKAGLGFYNVKQI